MFWRQTNEVKSFSLVAFSPQCMAEEFRKGFLVRAFVISFFKEHFKTAKGRETIFLAG